MNSVITFLTGTILGFFGNRILEFLEKKFKKKFSLYRIKKEVKKNKSENEEDINVISIANGYPYFNKTNMNVIKTEKKLFISFPEELLDKLEANKRSGFKEDCSFDGNNTFLDIVEETGINNLIDLINKHRIIVANKFINEENGCYFNGDKYGVFEINSFGRTLDEKEEPILSIKLFNTDYFTHKVFKSIYKEIKNTNPIGKTTLRDFSKYRSFATSFRINGLVGVKSSIYNSSVIITKRSIFSTESNNEELHSVSVIEGLSGTDYDSYNDKVDFYQCFKRGITEELGIDEMMYNDSNIKFYDVFLERNNFELGITCFVNLDDKYIYERDIENINGRDSLLEIATKFVQPFNKKELKKFVQNNRFNKQSIYTLMSILARE